MQGARRGACRLAVEQGPARLLRPGQRQIGGLLQALSQRRWSSPRRLRTWFPADLRGTGDDAVPGQQDTVAHPVELVVEPDCGVCESMSWRSPKASRKPPGRSPPRPGCWRTHRRRAWLALPARLAEHLQGGECGVVDGSGGGCAGSSSPPRRRTPRPASGTPSSNRVVKSAITSPIRGSSACRSNNGHVEEKFRAFAPARQDQREAQPNTLDKVTPCCAARRSRRRLCRRKAGMPGAGCAAGGCFPARRPTAGPARRQARQAFSQ